MSAMTRPDEGLVYFIQCIETENYQSLTTDKIWHAKSDLTYILKDIVGARGDNVSLNNDKRLHIKSS